MATPNYPAGVFTDKTHVENFIYFFSMLILFDESPVFATIDCGEDVTGIAAESNVFIDKHALGDEYIIKVQYLLYPLLATIICFKN